MSKLKALVLLTLAAGLTAPVLAERVYEKAPYDGPPNLPVPAVQGGDNIGNATVIGALPYTNTGMTTGYNNDYDAVCPYTGSTSPDVVYAYTPTADMRVKFDLCGSLYDTKLYVFENVAGNVVACNDDFWYDATCGYYTSFIDCLQLTAGNTYYIVVDGYSGAFGAYTLAVTECPPPPQPQPCDHVLTIQMCDSYGDGWNGGHLDFTAAGYLTQSVTLPNGSNGTATVCIGNCIPNMATWIPGSWPYEPAFEIWYGNQLLGSYGTYGQGYDCLGNPQTGFSLPIEICIMVGADETPAGFTLAQNTPNPFNPTTTISFTMDETAAASLRVYDLGGHAVATLVEGMVERGEHRVVFDASQLASGVYFYTLEANGAVETRKMVLMK